MATQNGNASISSAPEDGSGSAAAPPPEAAVPPPKPKVRLVSYQTGYDFVVCVMAKNLKKEEVSVEFGEEKFRVTAKLSDGSDYESEIHCAKKINPENCTFKVLSTKVEIRLRKLEGGIWPALEAEKSVSKNFKPYYPSSSTKKHDWDKVEREIKKQEEEPEEGSRSAAAPPPDAAAAATVPPPKPKVHLDSYQTEYDFVVSVMAKNLKKEEVSVEFGEEKFIVKAKLSDGSDYESEIHCAKKINPENCTFKVLSTKVEIRLRKLEGGIWPALEAEKSVSKEQLPREANVAAENQNLNPSDIPPQRPEMEVQHAPNQARIKRKSLWKRWIDCQRIIPTFCRDSTPVQKPINVGESDAEDLYDDLVDDISTFREPQQAEESLLLAALFEGVANPVRDPSTPVKVHKMAVRLSKVSHDIRKVATSSAIAIIGVKHGVKQASWKGYVESSAAESTDLDEPQKRNSQLLDVESLYEERRTPDAPRPDPEPRPGTSKMMYAEDLRSFGLTEAIVHPHPKSDEDTGDKITAGKVGVTEDALVKGKWVKIFHPSEDLTSFSLHPDTHNSLVDLAQIMMREAYSDAVRIMSFLKERAIACVRCLSRNRLAIIHQLEDGYIELGGIRFHVGGLTANVLIALLIILGYLSRVEENNNTE